MSETLAKLSPGGGSIYPGNALRYRKKPLGENIACLRAATITPGPKGTVN